MDGHRFLFYHSKGGEGKGWAIFFNHSWGEQGVATNFFNHCRVAIRVSPPSFTIPTAGQRDASFLFTNTGVDRGWTPFFLRIPGDGVDRGWQPNRFVPFYGVARISFLPFLGGQGMHNFFSVYGGGDRVANIFFTLGGRAPLFTILVVNRGFFLYGAGGKGVATILRLPFRGDRSGPKAGFRRPGPESPGPARDGPGFY